MMKAPFIVGFGGTTRPGSSSERLVDAVLARCAEIGAHTKLFGGASLAALPHFAPECTERSQEQMEFVDAVRQADGLVIGTPGYHGGVSGLVKNAIDLLEDTRSDHRTYFDGLPIGIVVSAAGWQAGGVTLSAMRGIVHAMRGWPTPLGIAVNSIGQPLFRADGSLEEPIDEMAREQARQIMVLARFQSGQQAPSTSWQASTA